MCAPLVLRGKPGNEATNTVGPVYIPHFLSRTYRLSKVVTVGILTVASASLQHACILIITNQSPQLKCSDDEVVYLTYSNGVDIPHSITYRTWYVIYLTQLYHDQVAVHDSKTTK